MKKSLMLSISMLIVTTVAAQNIADRPTDTGQPGKFAVLFYGAGEDTGVKDRVKGWNPDGNRTAFRLGFTQAIVPFGIWSDQPGPLFENNDFNFYLDDDYGFSVEYQFFNSRLAGVQAGGFYFYAKESDFVNDNTAETFNSMTLEGGGVYGGITLRTGTRHFGARSALNFGYFTFDYRMKLTYKTQFMSGFVTEYKGEALSGIGTRLDAGLYFEYGRFGVYPVFQIMYLAKNGPSALILKTLNVSAGYSF